MVKTDKWGKSNNCVNVNNSAYQYVLESKTIDTVILVALAQNMELWGVGNLPPTSTLEQKFQVLKALLDRDIDDLKSHGKKVILTYDMPTSPIMPNSCIQRPLKDTACTVTESQLVDWHPFVDLFENAYGNRSDICIFHQSNVLVMDGKLVMFDRSGRFLMRDDHHLSLYGSKLMAKKLLRSGCLQTD